MNLSKLSLSQLVNLSLAVFLFFGIAVTTYNINNINSSNAEAAKGGAGGSTGSGGKGGKTTKYVGTCAVTPNPAPLGSSTTISGSGFRPNVGLGIITTGSGGTQMGFVYTDTVGNFSTVGSATWIGTELISIQDGTVGSASCSFTVQ